MVESSEAVPASPLQAIFGRLRHLEQHTDVVFAIGIIAILGVLLFPVPNSMLDFLLALSITFSSIILMTVLFINRPLDFSAFPTILLIAAIFRLALNIASTRLILSQGHMGTEAAGKVIEAFGMFVMTGSVVIGAIVFIILTLINFIVITKGSGRIAEVSARFSLDAMPGKQMAIDADLSAGLINDEVAKLRRKELEDESTFFGAMDGASKFVRGDAIAGILITIINFVGGIVIGVVQRDMDFSDALQTYTLLTIGDGLVSQIPALIVSTAAGMLVTKSGVTGSADKAIIHQLGKHPQVMGLSSALLFSLGLIPSLPAFPFFVLSGLTGGAAFYLQRSRVREQVEQEEVAQAEARAEAAPVEETPQQALMMDALRLELGYGLLSLINYEKGHRLTDQIKALRKQLVRDIGFIMPSVRIQDNMQLAANRYSIKLKDIEAGGGDIRPDMLMVMDPRGGAIDLPGEDTREPAFGLPAKWISESSREEALFRNYTVVDPPTVITTHLTEIIKENIADLLTYAETQKLLDSLGNEQKKLIDDTVPSQITVSGVQRVLQRLLHEQVSIRDLSTIMEAVAEYSAHTRNLTTITEHVRARLARQISFQHSSAEGVLPIVALSPEWEQRFAESLIGNDEDRQLAMPPSQLQEFIKKVRDTMDKLAMKGDIPVLLTSPGIRPYIRAVVERFRPATPVLSQGEIYAKAKLKNLGQI
ncbi:MAG: flagellar biosynthesis protein FlhA [Hyphomicrobiales bacterium]|nr:flagellar biosynthesis protein FlhA [Hyphomicrobiales bacterium]